MNKNTQPEGNLIQKEINVYELELSQFNKIIFSITEFRGKRYINIRTWIRVHPAQQEWGRTQKGIFVEVSKIKGIQEGISRLAEHLDKGHSKKEQEHEKKNTLTN